MRHVASIAIGIWYGVVVWYALSFGIYELPRLSGARGNLVLNRHYAWLLGVAWLVSVLIGCVLAAESSRERPVQSAFVTALLLAFPMCLLTLINFFSRVVYALVVLTLIVGFSAGRYIKEQRIESTRLEGSASGLRQNEAFAIYGIGWKSWLWLWMPIYWWLYFVPAILYYTWLNLALDWHRTLQPALWFDWGWDFLAGTADALLGAAVSSLAFGAGFALISLSTSAMPGSTRTVLKKFLGWGIGLGMIATFVFLGVAASITRHLISMSTQQRPWWQFF